MNKLTFLIILILCFLSQAKVSMSNPNRICFFPEPDDSGYFGSSVVVNDKYLAVGDTGANRVIIYTRDAFGQWLRTKEILPPVDSVPYKVGHGFGRDLQLDGNVLVIGAITQQRTSEVTNPENFQPITTHYTPYVLTFEGRYLTRLDSETEVKAINLPIEKKSGFIQFNLLLEGKIKQFIFSDKAEERFGSDLAQNNNLLLIGSPPWHTEGGAWLYDLNAPEIEPTKLVAPDIYTGSSVAISDRFAVVGDDGVWEYIPEEYLEHTQYRPKTLIKSLNSSVTTVIDSYGKLSLDDNILAILLPESEDGEQAALLEVFKLDDNTTPYLILRRRNLNHAWVQNGFLITVEGNLESGTKKVCIEPIR